MKVWSKLWLIPLMVTTGVTAARAETPCALVTLPSGQTTVTVQDHVPNFLSLCYRFSAHSGQTAHVAVGEGDDMSLGVERLEKDGHAHILGDSRKSMDISTDDADYQIYVSSRKLRDVDTSKVFDLAITLK